MKTKEKKKAFSNWTKQKNQNFRSGFSFVLEMGLLS